MHRQTSCESSWSEPWQCRRSLLVRDMRRRDPLSNITVLKRTAGQYTTLNRALLRPPSHDSHSPPTPIIIDSFCAPFFHSSHPPYIDPCTDGGFSRRSTSPVIIASSLQFLPFVLYSILPFPPTVLLSTPPFTPFDYPAHPYLSFHS